MCSCFSHAESARVFPALFPGISAQKKQHMLTQSRVRSTQKVQDTKLITIGRSEILQTDNYVCPFEDPGV